jgi:hypothetical protein
MHRKREAIPQARHAAGIGRQEREVGRAVIDQQRGAKRPADRAGRLRGKKSPDQRIPESAPPDLNAKCGKLGDFAQALFPLIVVNADDFGRLEGDAFTVKHKVFPVSPRTEEDFEIVLQAMSAVGLIRFYESGGDRYLEIVNFDREQPGLHKRTKSDYPDPPDDFGKFPEEQNLT